MASGRRVLCGLNGERKLTLGRSAYYSLQHDGRCYLRVLVRFCCVLSVEVVATYM